MIRNYMIINIKIYSAEFRVKKPLRLVCLFYSSLVECMGKPKLRGGLKMIAHTIVYIILSILSATAVFAAGMPISKDSPEQEQQEQQPARSEKDPTNTL